MTITDGNGCVHQDSVLSNPPAPLMLAATATDASCFGCSDGTINAFANAGNPPYLFGLQGGDTNSTGIFSGLLAGTYTVCVTDSNACTVCTTLVVGQPPSACSVTILTVDNSLCNGDCTGSLTAVANGVPPFHFQWSTSDTTSSIDSLCAGTYTVVMTDSTGCTSVATVTLLEPPPLQAVYSTVYGCDSCMTSVTANGGTPPYSYQWCDGSFGPVMYFCGPGMCIVIVVDANGCIDIDTINLNPPPALGISLQSTGTSCSGCNDGSIDGTASGGTQPYYFVLSPPGDTNTTGIFNALAPGLYNVCVYDSGNCMACDTITVFDDPTDIASRSQSRTVTVYPNPFTDETTLEVSQDILDEGPEFFLYDVLGKKVFNFIIAKQKTIISRRNLPAGIYFFEMLNAEGIIFNGKLIIVD
jgi:hypothetical protein